jgi:hypothetical protein
MDDCWTVLACHTHGTRLDTNPYLSRLLLVRLGLADPAARVISLFGRVLARSLFIPHCPDTAQICRELRISLDDYHTSRSTTSGGLAIHETI